MQLMQAEVDFEKNDKNIGVLILKYTMESELKEQIDTIQKIIDSDNFNIHDRATCRRP